MITGRKSFALLATVLIGLIFAGVNISASRWLAPARADFTTSGLFTLSEPTGDVLQRIVEPVRLELVYAQSAGADYPAIRNHAARVRELLHEMAAVAGPKLVLQETNPAPFSEVEDRISLAGLTAVPTGEGDPLYFGIIGRNSVDDQIIIPFLSPDRDSLLEYDLVRLIAQLDDPEPPVVTILSSLPRFQGEGTSESDAFILKEMRRSFQIRQASRDFFALPDDTDILMIIQPPELNAWQEFQIDQFLLTKGRAIIALDPASRIASGNRNARSQAEPGKIAETLGIRFSDDVVADESLGLPVETDAGGGRRIVESQPLFLAVTRDLLSTSDPATADLARSLNFGAAGWLEVSSGNGQLEILAQTTSNARSIPAELAARGPDPRSVTAAISGDAQARVLAARLHGSLSTAFRDETPKPDLPRDPVQRSIAESEMENLPQRRMSSAVEADIILIADSDVFGDAFYINPDGNSLIADNAAFILNALDTLAGGQGLSALRSRAPALRPMKRIDEMHAKATEKFREAQTDLEARLAASEEALAELQRTAAISAATGPIPRDPDPRADALRAEIMSAREELRTIERGFRKEIDGVESWLIGLNVWSPPLIVVLAGLVMFGWRRRRPGGFRMGHK